MLSSGKSIFREPKPPDHQRFKFLRGCKHQFGRHGAGNRPSFFCSQPLATEFRRQLVFLRPNRLPPASAARMELPGLPGLRPIKLFIRITIPASSAWLRFLPTTASSMTLTLPLSPGSGLALGMWRRTTFCVSRGPRTARFHNLACRLGRRQSKQLTSGQVDKMPNCSPDGKFVVYMSGQGDAARLMKISIEGGTPVKISGEPVRSPAISPDGGSAGVIYVPDETKPLKIAIVGLEGGEIRSAYEIQPGAVLSGDGGQRLAWTKDGRAVLYLVSRDGALVSGRSPSQRRERRLNRRSKS